jgi:hypothetical protein
MCFVRRMHVTGIPFLGSKVATPARLGRHGSRLSWKFGTAFSGLILLLGAEL